jgi:nitric oxide reductase subunit C
MHFSDPAFWRAGAISTIVVMSVVLVMLTIDSLAVISPGGVNVPLYTVINQHIDYKFDAKRGNDVPVIGGPEPLFGKSLDAAAATALIDRGKMVIQSHACIDSSNVRSADRLMTPSLPARRTDGLSRGWPPASSSGSCSRPAMWLWCGICRGVQTIIAIAVRPCSPAVGRA